MNLVRCECGKNGISRRFMVTNHCTFLSQQIKSICCFRGGPLFNGSNLVCVSMCFCLALSIPYYYIIEFSFRREYMQWKCEYEHERETFAQITIQSVHTKNNNVCNRIECKSNWYRCIDYLVSTVARCTIAHIIYNFHFFLQNKN